MCPDSKCEGQKQFIFTPGQFQLERTRFQNNIQKIHKRTETAGNKILQPNVNVAAPAIGMAVAAKS